MHQVRSRRRHQRFSFTGRHFGNLAVIENIAADKLDIIMPHVQVSAGRLAYRRENLRQNLLGTSAAGQKLFKFTGLRF